MARPNKSTSTDVIIVDGFSEQAKNLKNHFDERFGDSREALSSRFVWDYWYVAQQYKLIRTPAYHYFPEKNYNQFHRSLVQWGRQNLGCHDISPPWLSYYIDGCEQKLHADVPHGPWAFVYSLTLNPKLFSGGETQILRKSVLNYWDSFQETQGEREFDQFFQSISPKFNRLIVFDPRLPHGVSQVKGVDDPRSARIVIHGWFVEPRPYVEGTLTTAQVHRGLGPFMEKLSEQLPHWPLLHGVFTCRFETNSIGHVIKVDVLSNTLTVIGDRQETLGVFYQWFKDQLETLQFPKSKGKSFVTLPLVFKF